MRIGHGYDVHAFCEDRPLILGGIPIPYERGLAGHSDADVVAHAIMDALLGALRAGDIGQFFPDNDPAFAGADSCKLLGKVAQLVAEAGFEIVDVDATIAAEAPKLASHKYAMRKKIASVLGLDTEAVGIKATTTERLGFVGRKEGIAAWAVVLIDKRK